MFPNYDDGLRCAGCGGNNLHQFKIEVFQREEDANKGLHVVVEHDQARIDHSMSGNPSDRRQGLSIDFSCERCDDITVMTVVQHKGTTYINVEKRK